MHVVYLSVGSNQGTRRLNCLRGISAITGREHTRLTQQSLFYETEPVDMVNQPWFINAAVKIETSLKPIDLLGELKATEVMAGRDFDQVRFGPRTLDLDILLFDDQVIDTPDLTIPHPRMHKRRFVLRPLCDIEPQLVHPVLGKTIIQLLENLPENGQEIIRYACGLSSS